MSMRCVQSRVYKCVGEESTAVWEKNHQTNLMNLKTSQIGGWNDLESVYNRRLKSKTYRLKYSQFLPQVRHLRREYRFGLDSDNIGRTYANFEDDPDQKKIREFQSL